MTNSLATLLQHTKESEQADLTKKYNSIMLAPKAALWMGFLPQVQLPPDATCPMVRNQNPNSNQGRINSTLRNQQNQGLPACGMGAWHLTHARDRARFNPPT